VKTETKPTATKEEATPALLPKLRFPEFRNESGWQQKEVGEVFQVTRGNVLSMTLVQDEKSDAMPFPVYSSQTKNKGLSGYYSDFLFEDAITWTTDGANAGDVNFRTGKFYCTNVCGVLLSSKGFANACVAALINSVARKYVSYVGNPKLMNGVMSKIPIPLPPLAEQQKIAECLSSVDELMAAQARKVDALKTHKKGLMQQLFPREGETQPRLRFPEFQNAGEWEPKTLIDACRMQAGKFVTAAEIKDQNAGDMFPCYGGNGLRGFTATFTHNGVYPLIGRQGALCGNVKLASGQFHATEHAVVATPRKGVEVVWLYYVLDLLNLNRFATGQAQPGLSVDVLEKVAVAIPNDEREQQRIATCLSSLDALITAETQKHEALKTHKKGLMQQLFPSPEEVEA
jgi:type I restriction enzyme S subunit